MRFAWAQPTPRASAFRGAILPCLCPAPFCLQFGIAIRAGFALRFAWAQPSPRACFRVSRCYPCLFAPRAFCLQFGLASCAAFVLRFDRHRTALRGAALPSTALRNFTSPAQDTPPFADGSEERSPFCVSERPRCRSPKARTLRHRLSPRLARGIDGSLVAYPVIPAFCSLLRRCLLPSLACGIPDCGCVSRRVAKFNFSRVFLSRL